MENGALAHDVYGPAPRKGYEHVVGTLTVAIDPEVPLVKVNVGHFGIRVVERSCGVQPHCQQSEPLPRHSMESQEVVLIFVAEVPALTPLSVGKSRCRGRLPGPCIDGRPTHQPNVKQVYSEDRLGTLPNSRKQAVTE